MYNDSAGPESGNILALVLPIAFILLLMYGIGNFNKDKKQSLSFHKGDCIELKINNKKGQILEVTDQWKEKYLCRFEHSYSAEEVSGWELQPCKN